MSRQVAFYGIALGIASLAACAGDGRGRPTIDLPTASVPAPAPAVAPASAAPATVATPDPRSAWITGSYSMTIELGPGCDAIPAAERSRKYDATIAPHHDGGYLATASASTFLKGPICTEGSGRFAGVGCDQFFVATQGDDVTLSLDNNNDEAHGGHLTERTASGTWLALIGTAAGSVDRRSRITASGPVTAWYCPVPSDYPFPCPTFTGCQSTMQVTLTRR